MQYTSLMDILPMLVESSANAKASRDSQTQARQQYEIGKLTNFDGYNPDAKEGLLDKLIPWQTKNERSVVANRTIDEIMQSNFGNYDYYQPTYDTKPLAIGKASVEGLVGGLGQAGDVLSQMASDVYNGGIKPVGQSIANSFKNDNAYADTSKVNNGYRDINYNYYASKYPKQKGESDQAYIDRLRHVSLTE